MNGELAGFLRCSKRSSEAMKLEEIYLASEHRGTGLGKVLLLRAEELARENGLGVVYLHVNRADLNSVAAYRKTGFVATESKVIDTGSGAIMHDCRMEMVLTPAQLQLQEVVLRCSHARRMLRDLIRPTLSAGRMNAKE